MVAAPDVNLGWFNAKFIVLLYAHLFTAAQLFAGAHVAKTSEHGVNLELHQTHVKRLMTEKPNRINVSNHLYKTILIQIIQLSTFTTPKNNLYKATKNCQNGDMTQHPFNTKINKLMHISVLTACLY
jgi:hypothetical protein